MKKQQQPKYLLLIGYVLEERMIHLSLLPGQVVWVKGTLALLQSFAIKQITLHNIFVSHLCLSYYLALSTVLQFNAITMPNINPE